MFIYVTHVHIYITFPIFPIHIYIHVGLHNISQSGVGVAPGGKCLALEVRERWVRLPAGDELSSARLVQGTYPRTSELQYKYPE